MKKHKKKLLNFINRFPFKNIKLFNFSNKYLKSHTIYNLESKMLIELFANLSVDLIG